MVNRITLLGRLGHDPELERLGENQTPHLQLRLAVDRRAGNEPAVDWLPVQVWGELAENCARYLSKGQRVYVEGRLQNSAWETDAGERRARLEVVAIRVVFLERPPQAEVTEAGAEGRE